jgi:hypothetical protein
MTIPTVLDSARAIEEHLRFAIGVADLQAPGVRFVLCDDDKRVVLHTHVDDSGADGECWPPPEEPDKRPADGLGDGLDATVTRWVNLMGDHGMPVTLVVAVTRPGLPILNDEDRACFRAARTVCAEQGIRLLGVHLVTPRGQREIVLDDVI